MTQSKVELELFNRLPSSTEVIFDIGTRDDVDYLKIKPNCSYYLFEPNSAHFQSLKRKVSEFGSSKIYCLPIGFSNRSELNATYYRCTESFVQHWQGLSRDEGDKFDLYLLDEFIQSNQIKKIDFLKTDCEQMDHLVVEGGLDSIEKIGVSYIQCECSDIDVLSSLLPGYKQFIIMDEAFVYAITSDSRIKDKIFFSCELSLLHMVEEVKQFLKSEVFPLAYGCNLLFVRHGVDFNNLFFNISEYT